MRGAAAIEVVDTRRQLSIYLAPPYRCTYRLMVDGEPNQSSSVADSTLTSSGFMAFQAETVTRRLLGF